MCLWVARLQLMSSIKALEEVNPMLGFRGCRLSVLYPEITEMQVRAVIQGEAGGQTRGQARTNERRVACPGVDGPDCACLSWPVCVARCDRGA